MSCLFIFLHADYSQQKKEDNVHICISALEIEPMSAQFNINIFKSANSVKLVYAIYDSIRLTDLNRDTAYQRLHNLKYLSAKQNTAVFNQIRQIFVKYEVYTKDSIVVNSSNEPDYINLIYNVAFAPNEQLKDPQDRIVADGMSVSFTITTSKGSRRVETTAPEPSVNSLLYRLFTQTLKQYRKNKGDIFLNKHRTGGY